MTTLQNKSRKQLMTVKWLNEGREESVSSERPTLLFPKILMPTLMSFQDGGVNLQPRLVWFRVVGF